MSKTEETRRLCVGVDLHKTQFTVSALTEDGEVVLQEEYRTTPEGYSEFIEEMHRYEEEDGCSIELAVETTGNARFFKNQMEKEFFDVTVVNTNKFKVITYSTKKTDANDALTLAMYLQKEMLPEAHLCSQTSEEIRRMLKTRRILVQSSVKIKNQIHGMLLGYGIETNAAQFQSKRKRQELMNDLANHYYSDFTASSLEVMLNILDVLAEQIKDVEEQIESMVEAYIGIVPSVHNSNETVHLGHITKHGPQELRTAFVQVALGMIRASKQTSEWRLIEDYRRKKTEKGSGRAIIALTRKIARIVFVMLENRETFNPELMLSK